MWKLYIHDTEISTISTMDNPKHSLVMDTEAWVLTWPDWSDLLHSPSFHILLSKVLTPHSYPAQARWARAETCVVTTLPRPELYYRLQEFDIFGSRAARIPFHHSAVENTATLTCTCSPALCASIDNRGGYQNLILHFISKQISILALDFGQNRLGGHC